MKSYTKIIIFLVIAFIIIVGITFATHTASAPVTGGVTPTPSVTSSPATSPAANYTLAQVALHKTPTDCWTSVSGGVYNLTPFVNQHPGGVEKIIKLCGIEGTALFTTQHGGQARPETELASLKIGTLAQ